MGVEKQNPEAGLFRSRAQLYCLGIENRRAGTLEVGALGILEWPRGWTYYVGRSHHGWPTRVGRFQEEFTPHWHVDYLLEHDFARLRAVLPVNWPGNRECDLVQAVRESADVRPLKPGFGASDCPETCSSHAWFGTEEPDRIYARIRDRIPSVCGWVHCGEHAWDWVEPDAHGS